MVVREGAELALILRAVELSSEGLAVWIGTSLGLGVAIAVGWFFFKGTLKISLGKIFCRHQHDSDSRCRSTGADRGFMN